MGRLREIDGGGAVGVHGEDLPVVVDVAFPGDPERQGLQMLTQRRLRRRGEQRRRQQRHYRTQKAPGGRSSAAARLAWRRPRPDGEGKVENRRRERRWPVVHLHSATSWIGPVLEYSAEMAIVFAVARAVFRTRGESCWPRRASPFREVRPRAFALGLARHRHKTHRQDGLAPEFAAPPTQQDQFLAPA